MRNNQPVTNKEVALREEVMIVSKTDLKGLITYINKDFLEISGFNEAELIGQPHNIVRHPDMPVEAFADLWQTLQAGRPWTGLVKNRCKNGDFYWVSANVAPIVEGGRVSGYLSVRRRPSRQQVEAAEAAYRRFRDKTAGGLRIRYGQVVRGKESRLADLSVGARLWMVLGLLALVMLGLSGYGLFSLATTNQSVFDLYSRRLEPMSNIGRIGKLMADNRAQVLLGMQHDPGGPYAQLHDHPLSLHTDAIEKNIAEIATLWTAYYAEIRSDGHRQMADAYTQARKKYVTEGLLPARQALIDGKFDEASLILLRKINPAYNEAAPKAEALFKYLSERAMSEYADSQARYENTRTAMILVLVLAILGCGMAALRLLRTIKRPLDEAAGTLNNVAQGNYSNLIDVSKNDELGRMLQGLQAMQTRLGFEVAETKRVADEMTRIKISLDGSAMPMTISDERNQTIYMNQAGAKLWSEMAARIAESHPGFTVAGMYGENLAQFFDDEATRQAYGAELVEPRTLDVRMGGKLLRVTATPVRNAQGQYLGRASQWLDRTAEVAVEQEVARIVDGAKNGDFGQRLALEGKQGFIRQLAEGLNQLAEVTSTGLQDVARVLNGVAQGDLTQTVSNEYSGIFGQLKDDTNTTVERLQEVMTQIKQATDAIDTAAKEIAAGNQDLSSRTEEQASSLEQTSSSMEELNSTVKQNADNALQANTLAKSSNAVATKGGEMVRRVVATMGDIQDSSKKIADIVGVIDSIAFQTNILALNAAVEAARAGEQGRGFAVVATEVRNLAQRSATAAKEIKTLIAESLNKVDGGAKLVQEAGNTMEEVVASFQQVANLVTDIDNASREQSAGIDQVTQAVSQMDEITQQNAALVEQAAAAAESLEEQARGLVEAVATFKLSRAGAAKKGNTLPAVVLRTISQAQLTDGSSHLHGLDFDAVLKAHQAWK